MMFELNCWENHRILEGTVNSPIIEAIEACMYALKIVCKVDKSFDCWRQDEGDLDGIYSTLIC